MCLLEFVTSEYTAPHYCDNYNPPHPPPYTEYQAGGMNVKVNIFMKEMLVH